MTLRLHNTLTGTRDEFTALAPPVATLYTCGPTIWNLAHVGNLRTFLFYDLLRRHLTISGYTVRQVLNLTDIDDRILQRAREAGQDIRDYAEPYATAFRSDLDELRVQPAEAMPRPTAFIPQMIALVERLLESGHAYRAGGDVFFRVDSFPTYGQLARLDRSGLLAGARVSQDDYEKDHAADFALWKGEQPGDREVGATWEAPFGAGRPGWHLECSAMAAQLLGPTVDIHAGAVDLLFPHHENEVAQSEAATGQPLARFWLHPAHLADATGEKMSKRLGNIATLQDLRDAGHDPVAIRFFLMTSAHYRARLRLDEAGLGAAAEQVRRLREFADRIGRPSSVGRADDELGARVAAARARYDAALDDDLNLAQGVGHLFEIIRDFNAVLDRGGADDAALAAARALLDAADRHLDILKGNDAQLESEITQLVAEREAARRARDFARADAIRSELAAQGILLEDSRDGVRWRRATP